MMTPVHSLWVLDLLDILLVTLLFYRLLILVKGTRSAQMYVGLLVIALIGLVAREFDLIAEEGEDLVKMCRRGHRYLNGGCGLVDGFRHGWPAVEGERLKDGPDSRVE